MKEDEDGRNLPDQRYPKGQARHVGRQLQHRKHSSQRLWEGIPEERYPLRRH